MLSTRIARLTLWTLLAPGLCGPSLLQAQSARISEQVRTLETYAFSEPNPIPMLARDTRLYPYHSFDGYSVDSEPRDWKVIHLENDLIDVWVLPEVGGKVWGARVKATGHEFVYRNEVMKFRNIALRGPWTSGGIEFNFGVIGHTPATATPVDYEIRENDDGSVSAIVGAMDLPSRTHWRVEIRLPADRAYFETRVLWSNPTPLEQPYYNWMTAAAFAQDDLEMSIPGNAYLEHPGTERLWPNDAEGRYLPSYDENQFGGNKSYHVVGELNDFFGGYFTQSDYGFGHWARHEDMPGQKLWLWALSRAGGIWEDLLTDTDGQYVELQAGRLLVQYSPGPEVNPIKQAGFDPMSASQWTETWFPVEGLGGLTDASKEGAMYLDRQGSNLAIAAHAFGDAVDTLEVFAGPRRIARREVRFSALEPWTTNLQVPEDSDLTVRFPALGLEYETNPSGRTLSRPFTTSPGALPAIPETTRMVMEADELRQGRWYPEARELYDRVLEREPWNRGALLGRAELALRSGQPGAALAHADRVRQLDAYDAQANFVAGTAYRALGQIADARDAFGWATRSVAYRSAAWGELAELALAREAFEDARVYARRALDFDRHSIPAWQTLAVTARLTGDRTLATEALGQLDQLDPLHHFADAERYLAEPSGALRDRFLAGLGGEYPEQTALELAIGYERRGLTQDAAGILTVRSHEGEGAVTQAWRAFLHRNASMLPEQVEVDFAVPYRPETLAVLEWAEAGSGPETETRRPDAWAWAYLRALNLWAVDRTEEAAATMRGLGARIPAASALAARALLLASIEDADPVPDLRRAATLEPGTRAYHVLLVQTLQAASDWNAALSATRDARQRFPDDFNLQLMEARSHLHLGDAAAAADLLDAVIVLPSEHARESHALYENAHLLLALDALDRSDGAEAQAHVATALEWPESLGQGRPYDPEERTARLLQGMAARAVGDSQAAEAAWERVVMATPPAGEGDVTRGPLDWTAVHALRLLDRGAEAGRLAAELEAQPNSDDTLDLTVLSRVLRAAEGTSR